MKLEFPNKTHKQMWEKLIKKWWKAETIPVSPSRLFSWKKFNDFLNLVENDTANSETWINAHLFFLVKDREILWAIQVRHSINHPNLIEKWWHIWYWIAPIFRKKGYGTKMLKLWLIEAKKIWLKKVLITCYTDNVWSDKVIKTNSGVFERLTKNWKTNRYWIEL